jgi:hypothetical protein
METIIVGILTYLAATAVILFLVFAWIMLVVGIFQALSGEL